jgi:hypothetical protein
VFKINSSAKYILVISIAFGISACSPTATFSTVSLSSTPSVEWSIEYAATTSVDSLKQPDSREIVGYLFDQWLDHSKLLEAPLRYRLDDYQITEVVLPENLETLAKEQSVDFVAAVTFSVKPAVAPYSYWVAGNGTVTEDGWIKNKFLLVGVVEKDNLYKLSVIGTGP